ncbi:MAG: glycosyltransferase family 39 protein [Acidobacteria bacterium]|nr:glycosyltransferase family 39 protein [Acidobacteriota bacterium]
MAALTIAATAVFLRLTALGRQPLWLDEATDAAFAQRSLHDCIFAEIVHPPLYRTLLHFMVVSFGDSAFVLRLLPALFGILAVAAAIPLARRLLPQAALSFGILTATSPFLIFYSQENRNYSLFVLLTLLGTWIYLRFRETGKALWLYAFISALLMYTHYLAIFVLVAHEWIYWRFSRRNAASWVAARLAVAAAFAPWCWWVATHYWSESRLFVPPVLLVPLAVLRFFLGYGIAAADAARQAQSISVNVLQEAPVVLPSLALFVWLVYRGIRSITTRETRELLAAVILFPWTALVLLAPWVQLTHDRYLVFQAPFLLLLVAASFCSLTKRGRMGAAGSLGIVIAFSLAAYYAAPAIVFGYQFRYAKENWAEAARFIRQQQADAVVVAPGYLRLPLDRYSLGSADEIPLTAAGSLPDLQGYRRVALVISRAAREELLATYLASSYRLVARAEFTPQNAIRVLIYERAASGPVLVADVPAPAGTKQRR